MQAHSLSLPGRKFPAGLCGRVSACLAAAAFGFAFAPPAIAHDIVLVPSASASALTVRYGHPGDWLPVDVEKLLTLMRFDGKGNAMEVIGATRPQGLTRELRGARGAALYAARYDNGLWIRLPGETGKPVFRNASRFMIPEGTEPLASIKFAKALQASPGDDLLFKKEVGHLLELIPQRNPLALPPGSALPVLVRFNGQPLAGAGIEVSNLVDKIPEEKIVRYATDADGIARVTVRAKGLNVLAVDLQAPNDGRLGPHARALPVDKVMMVATYAFVR